MFGIGSRKDAEIKRLSEREGSINTQLQQALAELAEAREANVAAEARINFLGGQNKALAKKVQRLSLQKQEYHTENQSLRAEQHNLTISKLQAECQTQVLQLEQKDNKHQIQQLKASMKEQATKFDQKMEALKLKTKKLIGAVLPTARATSATFSASVEHTEDGMAPAATAVIGFDDNDVQQKLLEIVVKLYDEELSEDEAVQQLSELKCSLQLLSPEPAPVATLPKVDAATDTEPSLHPELDTPQESEDAGAATPSESPSSPRPALPPVNLAALVADAVEHCPSERSFRTNASASNNFGFYTQFVLAEPEKLQRLIQKAQAMRQQAPAPAMEAASSQLGYLRNAKSDMLASEPGENFFKPESSNFASRLGNRLMSMGSISSSSTSSNNSTAPVAAIAGGSVTGARAPSPTPNISDVSKAPLARKTSGTPKFLNNDAKPPRTDAPSGLSFKALTGAGSKGQKSDFSSMDDDKFLFGGSSTDLQVRK